MKHNSMTKRTESFKQHIEKTTETRRTTAAKRVPRAPRDATGFAFGFCPFSGTFSSFFSSSYTAGVRALKPFVDDADAEGGLAAGPDTDRVSGVGATDAEEEAADVEGVARVTDNVVDFGVRDDPEISVVDEAAEEFLSLEKVVRVDEAGASTGDTVTVFGNSTTRGEVETFFGFGDSDASSSSGGEVPSYRAPTGVVTVTGVNAVCVTIIGVGFLGGCSVTIFGGESLLTAHAAAAVAAALI